MSISAVNRLYIVGDSTAICGTPTLILLVVEVLLTVILYRRFCCCRKLYLSLTTSLLMQ